MCPVLEDLGIPHLNQTAYHRGVLIHDASFAIQETIKKYVWDSDIVYQLFYDLEKAFDSVEFPVILSHVHRCGIKGRAWRVVRSF